jgi:hypothetical protein
MLHGQGWLAWSKAFLDALSCWREENEAIKVIGRDKGSKVMLVTDRQGVPVGALVHSAQAAEGYLAEATGKTM